MNKISLNQHISAKNYNKVANVFQHLFKNSPINYFCFMRRYRDGTCTFLPSIMDFGCYLFEDGNYVNSWFAAIPFEELKTGYMLWDIAAKLSNETAQGMASKVAFDFHLSSGIDFVDAYDLFCDFYVFAGVSAEVYSVPQKLLRDYIFHFKNECKELLDNASHDKFLLSDVNQVIASNPIVQQGVAVQSDLPFAIKRYYLSSKRESLFLTQREVEIVRLLDIGLSAKVAADRLSISSRTLEQHISNIKRKLGVSCSSKMLFILREYNVLG